MDKSWILTQEEEKLYASTDDFSDLEYKDMSGEGQDWNPAVDEDIIQTFLEGKVESMVKEFLAQHSEALIDLAIKTYILRKKNEKIERKSYTLSKKSVKK